MIKKVAHILLTLLLMGGHFFIPFEAAKAVDGEMLRFKQEELTEVKGQILDYSKNVKYKEKEISNLEQALKEIDEDIGKTNESIETTKKNIDKIESEIKRYNQLIIEEEAAIKHQRVLIAEYLREIYELENMTVLQTILSKKKISDFVENKESIQQIQKSVNDAIQEVKERKFRLEKAKSELEMKKQEQDDLKALQEVQKISLLEKSEEKAFLLEKTKNDKIKLEKLLNEAREKFDSLRREIKLIGGNETLSFEQALKNAQWVESKTGVRPAFLLAILRQESNWGKNTGTSIYIDALTNCIDGKKDQYGNAYERAMSVASRRENDFISVVKELGLPDTTLVSACPKSYLGSGGAMGPAQFMPDTWLAYKEELKTLKGTTPSPFEIDDAMLAMGMKLARAGANSATYEAEWKSAMIYFAGGNWDNTSFSFYGDSVMNLAQGYQQEIEKFNSLPVASVSGIKR